MGPLPKIAIGLIAALGIGAIHHGPLGHGAAFIDPIEAEAKAVVARTEVPGVTVVMGRDPLSRTAFLSGPADSFQRAGRGEFPGIDDRVLAVPGVARIHWTNPPTPRD